MHVAQKGHSFAYTCSVEQPSAVFQLQQPSFDSGRPLSSSSRGTQFAHPHSDFRAKSLRRPPLHHETDFENPNETSGVIQLDRAVPGPRSLLGQLDRPKEEVRRPLGLPLPNSHHPQDTVRDHALRGRERQPPDRPVDVQVKPAVLDLGKCAGTKMVPRAKHGGVRDQKKILAT